MQAIGSAGAFSRLVQFRQFPMGLAVAQRVLAGSGGAASCRAVYHGHNWRAYTLPQEGLLKGKDMLSPLSFLSDERVLYSTLSSKSQKKKVLTRAAVSSRPKPSAKPNSRPSSRSKQTEKEEQPAAKRIPAPWLIAQEDVRRQASSDKKAKKQEAALNRGHPLEEVDIFGVPLNDAKPSVEKMGVKDYEPNNLKLRSAEFVISSTDVSKCPDTGLPEFAVVGRSNVGKSSLINMLTNRKSLAMTSKKPGKTQTINHFLINDDWYLVDLPGYGYAAAPGRARSAWNEFTKDYFLNRKQLVTVLLLVDASIPPQQIDLECADWLGENQVPLSLVFTKCDKRKKTKAGGKHPLENIADFESMLGSSWEEPPPKILTSSVTRMGRQELLSHLSQLRSFWKDQD